MNNGRHFSGRLLAALLCIILVASMIPVFASAALPKGPKMKKLNYVETGVKVRWNSVSGVSGYRIFRKVGAKGAWKAIGETTGTAYTDKSASSGNTYYYAVRTLNSAGKVKSDYSPNPQSILYYKTPQMKSATAQSGSIVVKWKGSKGAPLYRVFRSVDGGAWKQIGTSKTTQYVDKKVKAGKEYAYRVRVVNASNKKQLSSYDHTPVSTLYVKKAEIKSLTNQNGKILVKWSKIKGASQYRLFRKLGQGDWFTMTTTTSLSYTDTDVKNNLTYTYQVRAMDGSGNYVGAYDKGKSITYYSMPDLVNCVRSGSNLVTTWDAVEGISNYVVFRRIGGGDWIKMGTSTTTSYSDSTMPSGTYCEYTVACADSSGKAVSAYGVNIVGAESYKDIPILTGISNGDGSVTVTWQSVDTASDYRVFRKVGDNMATWVPIGTSGGNLYYKDTSVQNSKKYTYTVCTWDGSDETSMYNSTGLSITYYTPPTISSVTNEVNGAQIKWGKIDGVPNYKIWRKTGNAAWTAIATVNGASADYTYTDTGVVNNGHYNYSISCVADSESAYKTPGKDTTFYAAPAINAVVTEDGDIKITWSAVESISKYRVQRKAGSGSWTTVANNLSAKEYTDTSVTSGTKYTYRICSLKTDKVSGYRTTAARIYLDPPTITKATSNAKGKITVTWDVAVVGATTYDVYVRKNGSDTWTRKATGVKVSAKTSTVSDLESGVYYSVKLVAVAGDSRSADSKIKSNVSVK